MKTCLAIAASTLIFANTAFSDETKPGTGAIQGSALERSFETDDLPEIADGVARLRLHGKRFEAAIRMIEQARAKPSWGWDDTCGHDQIHAAQLLN